MKSNQPSLHETQGGSALAVVLGFGMAWVAMAAASAVLPPFRFPDDDTLREYGPVLLAYATWALTSLIGTILAWRCMRVR